MPETSAIESFLEEEKNVRKLKDKISAAKSAANSPGTPAYVKRELEHYELAANGIIEKYDNFQKEIDSCLGMASDLKKDWSEFERDLLGKVKGTEAKIKDAKSTGETKKPGEIKPETDTPKLFEKIEIFPAIYAHLQKHQDEVLGTDDIYRILKESNITISKRQLRRKLHNPEEEWKDRLNFSYEELKGSAKKHRITLKKEDEQYAMLDGFRVSKKELTFLEKYLPHGYSKESYELLFITKAPTKIENMGQLAGAVMNYLKNKGIDATMENGVLYAKQP